VTPLDRSRHAVLVPSAHSTAAIGVIRSLGRAGYHVHATASDSSALGLRSRFAARRVVHPTISSGEFAAWFANYVKQHEIKLIIPGGGFDLGGHPVFGDYAELFPTSIASTVLTVSRSKTDLFMRLLEGDENHRANLPPLLIVDFDRHVPTEQELAALPAPLFIKLDCANDASPFA
jgi:hypothetical protein